MTELPKRSVDRSSSPSFFDGQLNRQGVPTELSQGAKDRLFTIPGEPVDALTGIPMETDKMRTVITERLGKAMKTGQDFACVYTDTDNLKTANYIGRGFGDGILKADTAQVGKIIERVGAEEPVYFMRQTTAADETVVWMFGLDDEGIKSLRDETKKLNNRKTVVSVPVGEETTNYTLSTTAAMIDSKLPGLSERIERTVLWMRENEANGREVIPRNDYKEIKAEVDDTTKILKVAKDIARLPVEDLGTAESKHEVKEILTKIIANTRISEPFARTILTIMERSAVLNALTKPESRESMCIALGIDGDTHDALQFTDQDLRILYFDAILHKTYEEAGIDTSS